MEIRSSRSHRPSAPLSWLACAASASSLISAVAVWQQAAMPADEIARSLAQLQRGGQRFLIEGEPSKPEPPPPEAETTSRAPPVPSLLQAGVRQSIEVVSQQ